jgi:LacI family transcriptional regulator
MHKKIVTIHDVASLSGVSATAVSLVLNSRPNKIAPATQEKIHHAADALNYQPNMTARSLATKKTATIGIIIPDITNAFFAEAVKMIQLNLTQRGYDTFLCNSEEMFEQDLKYIQLLALRNVDGLILTLSAESLKPENWPIIQKSLARCEIPFVLFDRYYPGRDPKVMVDNTRCGYQAARYLITSGHVKIGVITGPMTLNSSINRLKGVQKAFCESGIELTDDAVFTGQYDLKSGCEGAQKLLGKVSAIFAFNDLQAYGVMEIAKAMAMSIPEDVSLIGVDDLAYSSLLWTNLTTLRQPLPELTERVCDLLFQVIHDPTYTEEIRLPATLVVRGSVKSCSNDEHDWNRRKRGGE